MKDIVPLSLGEGVTFILGKNLQWSSEVAESGQTRKKENSTLMSKKLEQNKEHLAKLTLRQDQIQQQLQQK
jgi:hypothetical protein